MACTGMQAVTIFSEPFDNGIGAFTIENKTLPSELSYVWKWQNAQYGMVASAYVSGTKYATESWLISPAIPLKDFYSSNPQLSFEHAVNKGTPSAFSVKITKDDGTTWENLSISNWPAGTNWNFINATADLNNYSEDTIRIAFCYVSSSSVAPQWEIKNLKITASTATVKIGDLYYTLNDIDHSAEVTYEYFESDKNYSDLSAVEIPSTVENDGVTYSVTSIGNAAFRLCSGLTSVTIPNSVTSIGWGAFSGCSGLTSVTIPNSVTSIGQIAFDNCSSLTSVTIPNSVTSIGGGAFSGCSSLTSVTIPNSVTSIGGTAFSGCSSLTSITLPDSIKNIKYWTFESCSSLTSITIPNSVTYIDYNAFRGCSSLTSVTIGESVSEIGNSAFENCTSLTSITIGESVSKIGYSAFSGCSSLTSITIPNSIRSIGDWAFRDCSSLTYIELLYIYIVIPDDALRGCINLTDIYVPCGGLAWMQQTWNDNLRQENRLKYKPLPYTVTTIATNGSVSVPQNQCDEMEVIAIPDYGYHFVQWSDGNTENPRSIELTKDTVFSAEFAPNIYSFSASCNENYGSVQATNGNYEYLTELTISATANEGYHFVQWSDGNTDNPRTIILSQDTSFTAEFAPNIYVITFMNDDSTVISAQQYGYGQMPIAPEFPTKAATAEYTYTFAGWIPEIVAVIGDATYKATFNATKNSYSITWLNEDGSLIDQTTVEYGVVPTHADPIKENTAEYTYTFAGWIPNVVAVTCDATYRATFNGEVNMYSITTSAINGEVEGAGIYAYGTEIEIKAIPAEGYTFDQWSDSVKDNPRTIIVTSDAEYTALFIQSQGIDDVYATDPVKKVINNDKIYILRGNKTYTLQGQEVK